MFIVPGGPETLVPALPSHEASSSSWISQLQAPACLLGLITGLTLPGSLGTSPAPPAPAHPLTSAFREGDTEILMRGAGAGAPGGHLAPLLASEAETGVRSRSELHLQGRSPRSLWSLCGITK